MALELREKQIEQLAFYIANKKALDLSDPGTGKTPPACVYAYYVWDREQGKTLWTMPKSILRKNEKEMLRFTNFKPEDVVILKTDRANLTKKWDGPTIDSTRRVATWELTDGRMTHELKHGPEKKRLELLYWDKEGLRTSLRTGKHVSGAYDQKKVVRYFVEPKLGPDGKPIKQWVDVPETFKDLIVANAGAKVFISTFAFMSAHWQRVLAANPDAKLLLTDEFHMPGGYSTPDSKATESFFHITKRLPRLLGMTGTIITGRLDSAYPMIAAIEPRYYGSFNGFMFEHAAVVDDYGRVIVWKNAHKVKDILARHSIKRTFEEVYGKEPVVFFTEYVDVSDEVKPHYDEFHEQALLELEDGRVLDGSMAGVAQMRARQILNHPETMFKNAPTWTPRDERIEIHLSEGKKTLIYASQKPEQERLVRLCESLGLRVALINSDVSGAGRAAIDELAQEGKLDVIVASGPTAAVGYNWEMFDLVLFASVDYMDTNILQAYRRASRGTRTSILRVVFIRYRNTVENRIYEIITDKSKLGNQVDPTRPILNFTEE